MNKKCRINYNPAYDQFELLLSTDGGETWDFSKGYPCVHSIKDDPAEEPMYIRCSLVSDLKEAICCGFEVVC